MRTTLDLDDRVLAAARSRARHEGVSLGKAISDLALQGLYATRTPTTQARNGIPQLQTTEGHVVTDDLVATHRDDE